MEKYVELLGRADTPNDGDAEALATIMSELSLTIEQMQADAAHVSTVIAATPHILAMQDRRASKAKADIAWETHVLETERLVKEIQANRQPKMDELTTLQMTATGLVSRSHAAIDSIQNPNVNFGIFKYLRLYPTDPLRLT